jgi:hypothetical protein
MAWLTKLLARARLSRESDVRRPVNRLPPQANGWAKQPQITQNFEQDSWSRPTAPKEVFPRVRGNELRESVTVMIATSYSTMLLIFAVGAGTVITYVLLVHKFLGKAK